MLNEKKKCQHSYAYYDIYNFINWVCMELC